MNKILKDKVHCYERMIIRSLKSKIREKIVIILRSKG
jgi:hypothetical protein